MSSQGFLQEGRSEEGSESERDVLTGEEMREGGRYEDATLLAFKTEKRAMS